MSLQQKFDIILNEYNKVISKTRFDMDYNKTDYLYQFISDRFLPWQLDQLFIM